MQSTVLLWQKLQLDWGLWFYNISIWNIKTHSCCCYRVFRVTVMVTEKPQSCLHVWDQKGGWTENSDCVILWNIKNKRGINNLIWAGQNWSCFDWIDFLWTPVLFTVWATIKHRDPNQSPVSTHQFRRTTIFPWQRRIHIFTGGACLYCCYKAHFNTSSSFFKNS